MGGIYTALFAMNEDMRYIKIRGKEYPLFFSLGAMKKLVNRYGSIEELGNTLENNYTKALEEMPWLISTLINHGLAVQDYEKGTTSTPVTPEHVDALMSLSELKTCQNDIIDAIVDGMKPDAETQQDNEVDIVLREIENEKNMTGAEGQ